jgi:hypothetical protein
MWLSQRYIATQFRSAVTIRDRNDDTLHVHWTFSEIRQAGTKFTLFTLAVWL